MDTANIDAFFDAHILPQAEWQARVEELSPLEARHLRERCERYAVECAMLAQYLAYRRHPEGDRGHGGASRRMEEARKAVKRALWIEYTRE